MKEDMKKFSKVTRETTSRTTSLRDTTSSSLNGDDTVEEVLEKRKEKFLEDFYKFEEEVWNKRAKLGLYTNRINRKIVDFLDFGRVELYYNYYSDKEKKKFFTPTLDKFNISHRLRIDPRAREYVLELFNKNYNYPQIVNMLAEKKVKLTSMTVCEIVKNELKEWREKNNKNRPDT